MSATEAQRAVRKAEREALESHLETRLIQHPDVPNGWQRQYQWSGNARRFVADFAWPRPYNLLVEVDGGTRSAGRTGHSTGVGIARDMVKGNEAQILGWTLLRFDAPMVRSDEAIDVIARWFATKGDA